MQMTTLLAYRQGWDDRMAGKPPVFPIDEALWPAYLRGYDEAHDCPRTPVERPQ